MDDNERTLNSLARMVGLFGNREWPYMEVLIEDDERRSYPISEDGVAIVNSARRVLRDAGREPAPVRNLGS